MGSDRVPRLSADCGRADTAPVLQNRQPAGRRGHIGGDCFAAGRAAFVRAGGDACAHHAAADRLSAGDGLPACSVGLRFFPHHGGVDHRGGRLFCAEYPAQNDDSDPVTGSEPARMGEKPADYGPAHTDGGAAGAARLAVCACPLSGVCAHQPEQLAVAEFSGVYGLFAVFVFRQHHHRHHPAGAFAAVRRFDFSGAHTGADVGGCPRPHEGNRKGGGRPAAAAAPGI